MDNNLNLENLIKKWSIKVNTPFGIDVYTLTFDSLNSTSETKSNKKISGLISDQKNSITFDNGIIEKKVFKCSFNTEFPIKSQVHIEINKISDNKIYGLIKIDDYLSTCFSGDYNVTL